MEGLFTLVKDKLSGLSAEDGLKRLCETFPNEQIKFSTALGEEDQVITHFIARNKLPITIFTLDTGRLFQETYDLLELTRKKYGVTIEDYFPAAADVENLVNTKGPNSFYESVENRKECCFIRKVKPLRRALADTTIWITGLRASQSEHRQSLHPVEWDADLKIIKYNPLVNWGFDEMHAFIKEHNVPVNTLHKKGFASIGCAPCTRAILEDEDIRAGRWYWENSHKECGLHEPAPANAVSK